jgi:hypothetical protein
MKNIIIFGTGVTAERLYNLLDFSRVNILAYADNNPSRWDLLIKGTKVVNPKYINEYEYDYIVIASQYTEEILNQLIGIGVNPNKVFQYFKFINQLTNPLKQLFDEYLAVSNIECIATGLSYVYNGFSKDLCLRKAFNFSLASQDLYYDHKIVKHILLNYPKEAESLKYVIIGLSYYSFQYDMSLSSMRAKVLMYYNLLKDCHHFTEVSRLQKSDETAAEDLLRKSKNGLVIYQPDKFELNSFQDKERLGKRQAELDCNKNYPNTVQENVKILQEYLSMLKERKIKPIIVVFPASKYYTNYFSNTIEEEFLSIIGKMKSEYDFQYIDYFRSELFDNEDFRDVSHLNTKGGEKFTKILNEIIEW